MVCAARVGLAEVRAGLAEGAAVMAEGMRGKTAGDQCELA